MTAGLKLSLLAWATVLAVLGVECLMLISRDIAWKRLASIPAATRRVVRRQRASDCHKQNAMLLLSLRSLGGSLRLAAFFGAFGALVAASCVIAALCSVPLWPFVSTPVGIITVTGMAGGWYWLRRANGGSPGHGYSKIDKALHYAALAVPSIAEASFELDHLVAPLPISGEAEHMMHFERPVFVAGLARAGTTVLMRRLYETGSFHSLTYRDMPFVLMPYVWRRLISASRKSATLSERAHADGLLVDFDSPEALEEVFWKTFYGSQYIFNDSLHPVVLPDEAAKRFRDYVWRLMETQSVPRAARYLSKNNNNLLRIDTLRTAFADACIVCPFREPIQHAASLLAQHRRFSDSGVADQFTRRYMRWLAHHEFGAEHRRFKFGAAACTSRCSNTIDYWLEIWVDAYRHVLERHSENVFFISYDQLCRDGESAWENLLNRLGVPLKAGTSPRADGFRRPTFHADSSFDDALADAAHDIYLRLSSCATASQGAASATPQAPCNP